MTSPQPVEQATSTGDAPQTPPQSGTGQPPALSKATFDAVPSMADALRSRVQTTPSSAVPTETSATNEPPAAAASATPPDPASPEAAQTPAPSPVGATGTPGDTSPVTVPATEIIATDAMPPGLSRKGRREWRAQQTAKAAETPVSDGALAVIPALSPEEEDDEFLVSEIRRAITPLADKVNQLASTVTSSPAPQQAAAQADLTRTYMELFGDDAEFNRRADAKVKGTAPLTLIEDEELGTWAQNRTARDFQSRLIQRDVSAVALGVAGTRGVDAQAITAAPSLTAVFDAFYTAGQQSGESAGKASVSTGQSRQLQEALAAVEVVKRETAAQISQLNATNEQLKTTNTQISDELEALRQRAPAMARQPISGGLSALTTGVGAPLDAQSQTGRQMLAVAAANRARMKNGQSSPAQRAQRS